MRSHHHCKVLTCGLETQRWGALWSRGQRRHSSASSDDGEDVSTNAQGTAEVTIEDVQSLQHAAGPTATTRCFALPRQGVRFMVRVRLDLRTCSCLR